MLGYWSSPDPAALLKLLLLNREAIDRMIYGRWWSVLLDQLRHLLRSNRKAQAKKNIAAHYDLGNDFYRLWLDPSMSYSSALFDGTGRWESPSALRKASSAKFSGPYRRLNPSGWDPRPAFLKSAAAGVRLARQL